MEQKQLIPISLTSLKYCTRIVLNTMARSRFIFYSKLGKNPCLLYVIIEKTLNLNRSFQISGSSETAKLSVYGARISTKTSTAFERKTRLKASSNCKEGVVAENIKKMKDAQIKKIEEKKRCVFSFL